MNPVAPALASRPLALLVDDDAIIRMEAADLLDEAGFAVVEAWSAASALDLLERRPDIGLLLTDVCMPGAADGFGLAREVARRWPGIRIVVMSGPMTPAGHDLPDGALFIDKPFSARHVLDAVRGIEGLS
ncbi:response regulator [uncultured Methylobacterium sp.]|uniref:response regulator n=1 Tax=uncultured Methylobacterium sp. TaxID=157278 RepID=UPI0035CABC10